MTIAVDTNILVYAHRSDSTFHPVARTLEQVDLWLESPSVVLTNPLTL